MQTVTIPAKLNREEAAAYLGTAKATLASWATRGGGPEFVKVGRKVIYLQTDLDKWMESRKTSCTAQLECRK